MKVLCILLCVAFASGFYTDNNKIHEDKIVGGAIFRIEDLPYQASLFWFRVHNMCGATIIHESWVITAAHCLSNDSRHLTVRTGSGYIQTYGKLHRVEKTIIHDDFENHFTKVNDIALIKLAEPIEFNNRQQPIELAKPRDIPKRDQLLRISGFGQIGLHQEKSNFLNSAYIPVKDQVYCQRVYRPYPITDGMFCAGNGYADPCVGDSGGPGVIHGKLYGIISFGRDCKSTIFPAVFTRVHKCHDWIEEKTGLRF